MVIYANKGFGTRVASDQADKLKGVGVVHMVFLWWMGGVVEDAKWGSVGRDVLSSPYEACGEDGDEGEGDWGLVRIKPIRGVKVIGVVHTTLPFGDFGFA